MNSQKNQIKLTPKDLADGLFFHGDWAWEFCYITPSYFYGIFESGYIVRKERNRYVDEEATKYLRSGKLMNVEQLLTSNNENLRKFANVAVGNSSATLVIL